jgi:hypothetical protein
MKRWTRAKLGLVVTLWASCALAAAPAPGSAPGSTPGNVSASGNVGATDAAGISEAAWTRGGDAAWNRPKRLVKLFDFEERKLGNFETMPMHWFAMGRLAGIGEDNFIRVPLHAQLLQQPMFGAHSITEFRHDQFVSGDTSFYLGLNGGSTGAFLEVGALPAIPNSDYLVSTFVRTDPLRYARVRLMAYFVDAKGRRIDASVSESERLQTDGRWRRLSVRLPGEHPDAAYIGIELELLQPTFDNGNPLGEHQVVYQEVNGGAWFDDVSVWQLPHVSVTTPGTVAIHNGKEPPPLTMQVRDLTGQVLETRVDVYDADMKPVGGDTHTLTQGGSPIWTWDPPLPGYGWYLVDMQVRDRSPADKRHGHASSPIARALTAFLWTGPGQALSGSDADRFTLLAEDLPDEELDLMAQLLRQSGLRSIVLSAWRRDSTLTNIEAQQQRLETVLKSLIYDGRSIALALAPLPDALARATDADNGDPLALLSHPREQWLPFLSPVLLRHGQRVRRWHLGSTSQPLAFFHPDLPQRLDQTAQVLRELAPQPLLVLPWRLDQTQRPGGAAATSFLMHVPHSVRPEHIRAHLTTDSSTTLVRPMSDLMLQLTEPRADAHSQHDRITDFALRMVHAWELQPAGLALSRPWTLDGTRRLRLQPDPLLGVYRSVAQHLTGRRPVGRLELSPGLRCLIFESPWAAATGSSDAQRANLAAIRKASFASDAAAAAPEVSISPSSSTSGSGDTSGNASGGTSGGGSGGLLVVWNESAPPGQDDIDLFLGPNPVAYDVWGNATALPLVDNRHRLHLTDTPQFIEGIDPALAVFRASFTLTPAFIESTQTRHDRIVTLTNPWRRTISGHFQVMDPADWFISPRRQFFSLAAGETATYSLQLSFPVHETAGPKQLVTRFDFTADQHYVVDLTTPVEIGLRDIDFDASVVLVSNPLTGKKDAVVTQLITNTGEHARALYAFANVVGQPRQERIIAQLKPGQSIVRRFTFPDAEATVRAHPVRAGLRETNGPALLSKLLTSPQ